MKKVLFLTAFLSFAFADQLFAQTDGPGADLFKTKCGICHTVGSGKLIGPDLAGVQQRRSEDWLIEFIRSSQTMINNGDADAVAIFEEYNQLAMPDPMISDPEIKSILAYIGEASAGAGAAVEYVSILDDANMDHFKRGKRLFQGRIRLANRGPSCISCHNGLSTTFFSEKSYSSKDVKESFATLGEAGVRGIIENPPYPMMAQAFNGHELEEDEVHDILVFLRDASGKAPAKSGMSSGYILYGILGAMVLFLIYGGLWFNRRGRTVNYEIFKRQKKSLN